MDNEPVQFHRLGAVSQFRWISRGEEPTYPACLVSEDRPQSLIVWFDHHCSLFDRFLVGSKDSHVRAGCYHLTLQIIVSSIRKPCDLHPAPSVKTDFWVEEELEVHYCELTQSDRALTRRNLVT